MLDLALVYFNQELIPHKKIEELTSNFVKQYFGLKFFVTEKT
jgi:hypothetical protein